ARHGCAGARPSAGVEARHGCAGARPSAGVEARHGGAGARPSAGVEARHGCAGARPSVGGLGAISGPPARMTGLRTRVLVLAGILALAFSGVLGRLGWLQIVRHGDLAALAERQYSRTVLLAAQRGPIVDRQGAALATSSPAESLFAQPRVVGDPVRVAARLAPLLGAPPEAIHTQLTSGRQFVWLRRKLPPATAAKIKALREPG